MREHMETFKSKGLVSIDMQETVQKQKEIPNKIRFPTEEYDRREFYETLDGIRYMVKLNLINGQKAEDVPVGIEDLVEFLGDVEWLINSTENLSVEYRNHDSWTAKLNTGDSTMMNSLDWVIFESELEDLAEEHGICLKKSVSMSGRGHSSIGQRMVGVTYSFGTYTESGEKDLIEDENNPMSKVSWVGGELGQKDDLRESTIQIKNVETVNNSFFRSIYNIMKSVFSTWD